MPDAWTLTHDATNQSLADWGVELAEWNEANHGLHTVAFATAGDGVAADGALQWGYGDRVKLYQGATKVFEGVVVSTPRRGAPTREGIDYIVANDWHFLERVIFEQQFGTRADLSDPEAAAVADGSARVYLCQDDSGSPIATGAQIAALVNYAVANSAASISLGSVLSGFTPNGVFEKAGVTCAEGVRAMLKLHPDAAAVWDYSGATPALSFVERASLTAVSLDVSDSATSEVERFEVRSRDDRVPPFVEVQYRVVTSVDGRSYFELQKDRYPTEATDRDGALIAVAETRGSDSTYHKQKVVTKTFPVPELVYDDTAGGYIPNTDFTSRDADWYAKARAFWKSHEPFLEDLDDADWTILTGTMHAKVAPREFDDTFADPSEEPPEYTVAELPRELLDGHVTDSWMADQVAGEGEDPDELVTAKVGRVFYGATLLYLGASPNHDKVRKLFPDSAFAEGKRLRARRALVPCKGTSATSGIYRSLVGYEEGETVPTGVAQAVYGSLSALEYEGQVTLKGADPSTALKVGTKLHLTNGLTAWATMGAVVQGVRRTFGGNSATTVATFGPPSHLTQQDLIALAKMFRDNPTSFRSEEERTEGVLADDSRAVEGGAVSAESNTTAAWEGDHPFKLSCTPIDATDTSLGYKVTVSYGRVQCEVEDGPPTWITPVQGANPISGTAAVLDMDKDDAQYFYFEHTLSAGKRVTTGIELIKSATTKSDTASTEYVLVGQIDTNGDEPVIDQHLFGEYYWSAGIDGEMKIINCDDTEEVVLEVKRGKVTFLANFAVGDCCNCSSGSGGEPL